MQRVLPTEVDRSAWPPVPEVTIPRQSRGFFRDRVIRPAAACPLRCGSQGTSTLSSSKTTTLSNVSPGRRSASRPIAAPEYCSPASMSCTWSERANSATSKTAQHLQPTSSTSWLSDRAGRAAVVGQITRSRQIPKNTLTDFSQVDHTSRWPVH